jgi:hypothetical protein
VPHNLRRVALALWFITGTTHAEDIPSDEPYEPEDIEPYSPPRAPSAALGPISDLALAAIRFYQVKIGPNSISRCPYLVSCSAFAYDQVYRLGFFGIPAIIDRMYYRENTDTFTKYPKYVLPSGLIKHDDGALHLE